jgi:hypothetical protein
MKKLMCAKNIHRNAKRRLIRGKTSFLFYVPLSCYINDQILHAQQFFMQIAKKKMMAKKKIVKRCEFEGYLNSK